MNDEEYHGVDGCRRTVGHDGADRGDGDPSCFSRKDRQYNQGVEDVPGCGPVATTDRISTLNPLRLEEAVVSGDIVSMYPAVGRHVATVLYQHPGHEGQQIAEDRYVRPTAMEG